MSKPKLYVIKQKASGVYFVEFWVGDDRRRLSCNTRDRKRADEVAAVIFEGNDTPKLKTVPAKPGQVTMAQLFDRCQATIWRPDKVKSQATIRSTIKILNTLIGKELVVEMTKKRLERLVEQLEAMEYAPGTIERKLASVGAALTRATEEEYANGTPWLIARPKLPSIVVNNFQDRVLQDHEEKAVMAAIQVRVANEPWRDLVWMRYATLIHFLLDTGCRLSEGLKLVTDRVDERVMPNGETKTFCTFPRYTGTKNGKPRQVILTTALAENMKAWTAIFGRNDHYFPLNAGAAWYMWDQIRRDCKAAGVDIDDVKLHTLRHTCLIRDNIAKPAQLTFADLAEVMAVSATVPTARAEKGAAMCVVPARFSPERRARANVVERFAFTGDVDGDKPGDPGFDGMVARLNDLGLAHIVHTTTKSTVSQNRYRVILPFDAPLTGAESEAAWSSINQMFGSIFDPKTFDAARLSIMPRAWFGAPPPDDFPDWDEAEAYHRFSYRDGDPVVVEAIMAAFPPALAPRREEDDGAALAAILSRAAVNVEFAELTDLDRSPLVTPDMVTEYLVRVSGRTVFPFHVPRFGPCADLGCEMRRGHHPRAGHGDEPSCR